MILIIVSLILVILTFLIICMDFKKDKFQFKPIALTSLLWLLLILFGCFSIVKTGEVGIKTRFGKIVGSTTSEGIVFKSPLDKINIINIKIQKYENRGGLATSTKDMQIVNNIKVVVNYQVDGKKAVDLYKTVGINYKDTILDPAIQETIKSVISQYTAEELVTKRSEVSVDINETLNEKINNYGIKSVSVAINNFDFSEEYNKAIENKAVAEQEVETSKNQLEKAKVDAETKKVIAQGEADANKIKEKTLTDNIIKQQFIEKWNGELPKVASGNNMIDISGLLK